MALPRVPRPQLDLCERKAMRKLSLTDVMLTSIERPRCTRCQTRMDLTRLTPLPDGSEKRMFECPKCHFIETKTVADPLKSDEIERLDHPFDPQPGFVQIATQAGSICVLTMPNRRPAFFVIRLVAGTS